MTLRDHFNLRIEKKKINCSNGQMENYRFSKHHDRPFNTNLDKVNQVQWGKVQSL